MSKKVFRRCCVLAYCSIIFYLSSRQIPSYMPNFLGFDKILHFIEYGILAFLCYRMFLNEDHEIIRARAFILSWVFTSFYGIFDEIHQSFVPKRMMSFWDWVTDTIAGLFVVLMIRRWSEPRRVRTNHLSCNVNEKNNL